jgi:hypothetical protein
MDYGHWTTEFSINEYNEKLHIGFIYAIVRNDGKYYIGKKLMTTKSKSSQWRTYVSSSKAIGEQILKNKEKFKFHILCFLSSKSLLNYVEAYIQFKYHALNNPLMLNGIVNLRCNGGCLSKKQDELKIVLQKLDKSPFGFDVAFC